MGTPAEFQAECKAIARVLRRLPPQLRRDLAADVRDQVAEPLAVAMRGALSGPYASALQGAVKTRVSADPQIVVGGARRVVSGGARQRQLIYGVEFGGGKKVARVPAGGKVRRHVGYRRKSTNQFVPAHPFIFSTVSEHGSRMLEAWADVVLKHIGEEIDHA